MKYSANSPVVQRAIKDPNSVSSSTLDVGGVTYTKTPTGYVSGTGQKLSSVSGSTVNKPITTAPLTVSQPNTPVSTPVTPPIANTNTPTTRDFEKEKAMMNKLGGAPQDAQETWDMLSATYTPAELSKLGITKEGILGSATDLATAREGTVANPNPTNSGLMVLQQALNAKSNITNQGLGTSGGFEQAGIGGYAVLSQSLNERSKEMNDKYNSFKTTVTTEFNRQNDAARLALDKYKVVKDEYDTLMGRVDSLNKSASDYEKELNLINEKTAADKAYAKYKAQMEGTYNEENDPDSPKYTGGVKIPDPKIIDPETGLATDGDGIEGYSDVSNSRIISGGASNGAGYIDPMELFSKTGYSIDTKIKTKASDFGSLVDSIGQVMARVTSPYGANHAHVSGESHHNGIDVVFKGNQVKALNGGRIVKAGVSPKTYGGYVWVADDKGNIMQYGHLSVAEVKKYQEQLKGGFIPVKQDSYFADAETTKGLMGASSGSHTDIRYVGSWITTGVKSSQGIGVFAPETEGTKWQGVEAKGVEYAPSQAAKDYAKQKLEVRIPSIRNMTYEEAVKVFPQYMMLWEKEYIDSQKGKTVNAPTQTNTAPTAPAPSSQMLSGLNL